MQSRLHGYAERMINARASLPSTLSVFVLVTLCVIAASSDARAQDHAKDAASKPTHASVEAPAQVAPVINTHPEIAAGETQLRSGGDATSTVYRYRLIEPRAEALATTNARVPLVVFLHGSGERGNDNNAQLVHFAAGCASDAFQTRAPCFVLAMQCPVDDVWSPIDIEGIRERHEMPAFRSTPTNAMRALMQAIDEVMATKAVDPTRVYLTGLSLGGFGSFDLAMRRPELFAAVIPICGGGDPTTATTIARMPFYIVHGSDDPIVPVELSRAMREAIAGASAELARDAKSKAGSGASAAQPMPKPAQKLKRAPNPMYREYDGVGHDSWTSAYRFGDDGVLDWMFAQRRDAKSNAAPLKDAAKPAKP